MSHDIRTPMNAVLGFTSLLEKEVDNPKKVREYVQKIKSSSEHLLELINEVLDITKIESGKNVLVLNEFSVREMVSSIENIIRQESSKKNQRLNISIENISHDILLGDVTKLNQICVNLLSNAVKYTQEQGNIWFNIVGMEQHSPQYQSVRIVVKDDGYGMSEDFIKILFEPFTRAENSTTNRVQGTGLGMAITKNLVELMDGTINVVSAIGKGTTFTIDLELRIPEESVVVLDNTTTSVEENILSGKHFLIAEDNEINAEIIIELLKLEGATCEIVSNGEKAVERFKSSKVDEFNAIFMDIQMPVMNGYEATKIIRSLDKSNAKTIPIIAMTANAFSEDIKDALNVGMNAHISKPINMKMLKNTVGKYL
jgi:CheY-like chemotaxis protein/two-component sensor histidine kinase